MTETEHCSASFLYLAQLMSCENPKELRERFAVYDNFSVFLYGNEEPLYNSITDAFMNSKKLLGEWSKTKEWNREGNGRGIRFHNYQHSVFVDNLTGQCGSLFLYPPEKHLLNGIPHSVFLIVHPMSEDMSNLAGLKPTIFNLVSYLTTHHYTYRLPQVGIDNIPKTV